MSSKCFCRRLIHGQFRHINASFSRRYNSTTAYPDVIHRIQTSTSTQDLYDYLTSLSPKYLNNNLSLTTTALSTASKFKDPDIGMKIYHYLINNNIPRTHSFYQSLFNLLNCNEYDHEHEESLNMDTIHTIIKQMTSDKIDLSSIHTDCVLKWVQCHKNPSIANLTNLYELFVEKLAIRPSHQTFEYLITGCCKAESVNDAINYFEIAINEFQDIPSVHTVRSLIECINKYSLQNQEDAVNKLEVVMNEMSAIYKKNDIAQYNELMNDPLIAFCAMDIYFNDGQYEKCTNIYDSIKNIENYSEYIGHEFLNAIYYKSCVQMMRRGGAAVKREYVEAIMEMNVDGMNEEMKMVNLDGMSWISLHKPSDFVVQRELINEKCSELFEQTQHFIFVDDVNKQKIVELNHLYSDEMRIAVIVYLLQIEREEYVFKFKMNENALLRSAVSAECQEWSMTIDENGYFVLVR